MAVVHDLGLLRVHHPVPTIEPGRLVRKTALCPPEQLFEKARALAAAANGHVRQSQLKHFRNNFNLFKKRLAIAIVCVLKRLLFLVQSLSKVH